MSSPARSDQTARERPLLVTFSGLDGSGKTTQIENLRKHLANANLRTVMLAFWDDVVVGKRYREGFVHRVYSSERGVGTPGSPVQRRDKNMRRWYLSFARHVLYLLDAIHLCEVVGRARRGSPDVIIMDRYIFDELANLPVENFFTRMYIRAIGAFVPKPDLALLLDADPDEARARKPEYPIDFMKAARLSYFYMAALVGKITVIPPVSLEDAKREVLVALRRVWPRTGNFNGVRRDDGLAAA
jgi:thymidylate kinase